MFDLIFEKDDFDFVFGKLTFQFLDYFLLTRALVAAHEKQRKTVGKPDGVGEISHLPLLV